MPYPTYISKRHDTGSYTLRYVVPAELRQLLGERREITKSLKTTDRRLALRLARLLAAMLDRFTFDLLMAKQRNKPDQPGSISANLTLKLLERVLSDGSSIKIESAEVNNAEDQKLLAGLLGTSATALASSADERTLSYRRSAAEATRAS